MARTASSLAKQVADLRKLVDEHLARSQRKRVLYAVYDAGATDEAIAAAEDQVVAAAGIDREQANWVHYIIIDPPPVIEAPRVQYGGPTRDNTFSEPRARFERKPDATVVLEEERPQPIDYPPSGLA